MNTYQLKRDDANFKYETGNRLMQIVLDICTNITENQGKYILSQSLIHIHHKFWRIITDEFDGEYPFLLPIQNAFESIMNETDDIILALASYCDKILKSYHPLYNIDITMKHIGMLYGYIRDKDRFQYIYKHHLNSRLLPLTTNTLFSNSIGNEMKMVKMLKSQHRSYWVTKIEQMLLEMRQNGSNSDSEMKSNGSDDIDINMTICGRKWWNDKSLLTTNWIIPKDLKMVYMAKETKYMNLYKNKRQLMLQMDKGTAEIQIEFNINTIKTLIVSTYQMSILLLFNDKDIVSFGEMKELTGINENELYPSLMSMAHPKIKILRKKPNDRNITDQHTFQINNKYQKKGDKIKVPTLQFPKYNNKMYANTWRIQASEKDVNAEQVPLKAKKEDIMVILSDAKLDAIPLYGKLSKENIQVLYTLYLKSKVNFYKASFDLGLFDEQIEVIMAHFSKFETY